MSEWLKEKSNEQTKNKKQKTKNKKQKKHANNHWDFLPLTVTYIVVKTDNHAVTLTIW